MTNGTGPGIEARLVEFAAAGNNQVAVCWSLQVSPDGNALVLVGQTDAGQVELLRAGIAWQANQPHLLCLDYGPQGTALLIDNQLCAWGTGTLVVPPQAGRLVIGSTFAGTEAAECTFDEIYTFGRPLGTNDLAFYYGSTRKQVALGPITEEELAARRAARLSGTTALATMSAMEQTAVAGPPMPGGDPGPTSEGGDSVPVTPAYNYPANKLWVEIVSASNNLASVVLHGTVQDMVYELLSKQGLTNDVVWVSEGTLLGAAGQDWTPATVTIGTRTNGLFLQARSWVDSDGNGLPDWWELQYFGTNGVDPYLVACGDGWTVYQKYQNGWNPTNFYTPPAPQGLTVHWAGPGAATAQITWSPSSGATSYTLDRSGDQIEITNAASFLDTLSSLDTTYGFTYRIQAHHGTIDSPWSESVSLYPTQARIWSKMLSGPKGRGVLLISPPPSGTTGLQITCEDFWGPETNFIVPISSVTNGIYILPDSPVPTVPDPALWWVQTIDANGKPSAASYAGYNPLVPFFDASSQLTNNLAFLLRAADKTRPFFVCLNKDYWGQCGDVIAYPNDYAYAGIIGSRGTIAQTQPFYDNYRLRNFVFSTADVDANGFLKTGVTAGYSWNDYLYAVPPFAYQFDYWSFSPSTDYLLPSDSQWIYSVPCSLQGMPKLDYFGAYYNPDAQTYGMAQGVSNLFGLPFVSAQLAYGSPGGIQYNVLFPDGQVAYPNSGDPLPGGVFYVATAQPVLQTLGYYFCRPWQDVGGKDPIPGEAAFSITNTTPPFMLASMGRTFEVAGYAKQRILNGDPNRFAYLGQYFERACRVDTNGLVTDTQAGIINDLGQFYPTIPGSAALLTRPDASQGGIQGTCLVQVIALCVDANHDGTIDPNLLGPDGTSGAKPYVFWLNNDFDRLWKDDDDGTNYEDSVTAAQGRNIPDCDYKDSLGNRTIPAKRDLEDFARLWICGIDSNVVAKLPPGTTITLSWDDVDNPNPNNPTIDLFNAIEPDGGIGYLTNGVIASQQANPFLSGPIGRLGPGQSIQLFPDQCGSLSWTRSHFIWCGVTNGAGSLTLTIDQGGTNLLGKTSAHIQLVDIKQMYERWSVGDEPKKAPKAEPQLAQEDLPVRFGYGAATSADTSYILYVHGWNMERWEKDRFAERAFKRLYWQGYQGRFGIFRWPTDYGFKGSWQALTDPRNFDNSEYRAWRSSAGLSNLLVNLNIQYPGHVYLLAHSMGNVVAGEALRLLGANRVVNTYVASQAAVPAHDYDPTVAAPYLLPFSYQYPTGPLNSLGVRDYGPTTPNIYNNWFATNNGATTRRVNFYNVNDFALAMPRWGFDQIMKPDTLPYGVYSYTGNINDPSPWNNFVYLPLGGSLDRLDIVNNLWDRYTVMAYAAEPRSTAFGATPGIATMDAELNLTTVWPTDSTGHNYADHFWHSAQFRGDNAQQLGYWHTLLFSPAKGFNLGIGSP